MKNILHRTLFISILLIFVSINAKAIEIDSLFEQGNAMFNASNYAEAIDKYETLIDSGYKSDELYYNLGNSYYRMGEIASAILNYERALVLKPSNENAQYNLHLANTKIVDIIGEVQQPFFEKWEENISKQLSSNLWSVINYILLLLALVCTMIFIMTRRVSVRRIFFLLGLLALVLMGVSINMSFEQARSRLDNPYSIVMSQRVQVKSSPSSTSSNLFIIHEGLKVKIVDKVGEWYEIQLSDGNQGWVSSSEVERIF
ncbi:MAG: tetratricopeptide repeat protein [Bacteroidales bacterium]